MSKNKGLNIDAFVDLALEACSNASGCACVINFFGT
jgi:hypothetical protein